MAVNERDARARERVTLRRDQVIARIKQIHALATSSTTDQASRAQLAIAIADIDNLWSNFVVENNNLLEILSELNLLGEFSLEVETTTRALVVEAKAMSAVAQPASVVSVGTIQQVTYDVQGDSASCSTSTSKDCPVSFVERAIAPARLPEIPLPYFDGECQNWPAFRDRFQALVDQRSNIPNIDKFYYLIGCLHADPQEVVKGYTVSNETYTLAWNALVERYDKPRKLASMIIDKLLSAPVASSETFVSLQTFLSNFDENIAVLESLRIPNLSSFLLFSLAARCLPVSSRHLFETENDEEYPSIHSVIKFVKTRIQVIENAGVQQSGSSSRPTITKKTGLSRDPKSTLVSTSDPTLSKPSLKTAPSKCVACSGAHRLADCSKFKSCSIDERYDLVCTHRLCMVCFGEGHMSFKCPASCTICKRRHHALLHRESKPTASNPPEPC